MIVYLYPYDKISILFGCNCDCFWIFLFLLYLLILIIRWVGILICISGCNLSVEGLSVFYLFDMHRLKHIPLLFYLLLSWIYYLIQILLWYYSPYRYHLSHQSKIGTSTIWFLSLLGCNSIHFQPTIILLLQISS